MYAVWDQSEYLTISSTKPETNILTSLTLAFCQTKVLQLLFSNIVLSTNKLNAVVIYYYNNIIIIIMIYRFFEYINIYIHTK